MNSMEDNSKIKEWQFFTSFKKKDRALFTTNIASRGLDFPKIDWVIQFDCPEDI